ncbi:MAG TPA: proline dehydrogenase family protein [Actinomycetales bacterium]|jgi:proline dehydrogenase
MLRQALLQMSKSSRVRRLVETAPISREVVRRFVAGAAGSDALRVSEQIIGTHRLVTLDHLGEDTTDISQARAVRDEYTSLLARLAEAGLTAGGRCEVSLKLTAVGLALGADGQKVALEHAWDVCMAASQAGTTVTIDMEDHTTTDATLAVVRELRGDFPWVGAVLQAYLRRTEADCADLSGPGSRVRLCKGAYDEPESVAFVEKAEVDRSYVRCLRTLMQGQGYPMVASHDPRLVDIAGALAVQNGRSQGSYEYQMLYGIRPTEQQRLADQGEKMRVYVPYGDQWYGYLMRRMAERPANTAFFLRSLATKG